VPHWSENIFFSFSGQYYIVPDLAGVASPEMARQYGVSGGIIPFPGFRIAAGYEWNNWLFSLELGFTYIKGDNPLVTNIFLIPSILKAGYTFYPISQYKQFTLTPTAGFGTVFAGADHYKDAIDMLLGIQSSSANNGLLIQAGLRAGWQPFSTTEGKIERKIEFFAGLSVDCIIEKEGIIPLPQLEIGIIVRPFIRVRPAPIAHNEPIKETDIIIEVTEILNEPDIILEYKREYLIIFFDTDSFTLSDNGIAVLDEVINAFNKYTEAKIIIRGYAAPYPSVWGQTELSRQRALSCIYYLTENDIKEEYLTIEAMGAGSLPQNTERSDTSRRRSVEVIIEGWIQP